MKLNTDDVRRAVEILAKGRPVRVEILLQLLAREIPEEGEMDLIAPSLDKIIHSLTPVEGEVMVAFSKMAMASAMEMIVKDARGNPASASRN